MDLIHWEYDLYNGEPFERFNLYSSNSYFLYLKYFEAAAINFIISNMTWISFSDINIHEFGDYPRNSRRINITKVPISFKINNS